MQKVFVKNGMTQYNTTQWWNKLCKFQFCAVGCSKIPNNKATFMSCFLDHLSIYDHNN